MAVTKTSSFKRAEKGKKPLRMVVGGASGSGKTYTSLLFSQYLSDLSGKPTACLDTEHGRMALYADQFDFDVIEVDPPFTPDRLTSLLAEAEEAGYGQFLIDSTTHFWNGSGGMLEIVNDIASKQFKGNSYMAWSKATPMQQAVVDALLRSNMHIIVTTRAKQEYAETEVNGKKRYEKLGMGMVQREGFEYDFDFALMMDMDNDAIVTKGMANVPPNTLFKKPELYAIKEIMRAITENSVELLGKEETSEYKSQIKTLMSENPNKVDSYKLLFKENDPNAMNKKEQFEKLITAMKEIK